MDGSVGNSNREESIVPLTQPGRYLLHLLVRRRVFSAPPFQKDPIVRAKSQAIWSAVEYDQIACRSEPVEIEINADGRVGFPMSREEVPSLHELDIDCRVANENRLEIAMRLILLQPRWMHDPFRLDEARPLEPVKVVIKPLGQAKQEVSIPFSLTGNEITPQVSQCVLVPSNGVVGTMVKRLPIMPRGDYLISAAVDESILREYLFPSSDASTSKNIPVPPSILWRSGTKKLTIGAIKQLQAVPQCGPD